jgi:hypothetical protein
MADEEKITALAHKYWEEEGCPEGRAAEHWARAESEIKQALHSEQSPLEEPPEGGHVKQE